MAEEAIRFKINVDGAEKSAQQFKQLSGGMAAANDNYKKLSENAAKTSTTLAAFGGALGQIDPRINAFGASIGRASGAIGAMTSVLGGPGGLLVGGAVAVLGLFAAGLKESRERSEELAKAERERAKATAAAADATNQANLKLLENLGKSAEVVRIEEELVRIRNKRAELGGGVGNLGGGATLVMPGMTEPTPFNAAAASKLDKEVARLEGELAKARKGKPGPKGPEFINYEEGAALYEGSAALAGLESRAAAYKSAADTIREIQKQMIADEKAATMKALQEEDEARTRAREKRFEDEKESREKYRQLDDEAKARVEQMRQVGVQTFSAIGSGAFSAFNQMAKGAKMSGRAFAEMIGDTIFAQGQGHFFLGLANAFIPGMQASSGPLMAIGGAEMAFGTALGAATAKRASGGGAGAGGRAESPRSGFSGGSGSGGPSTVVVNVQGLVVGTTADLGATVVRGMQEGVRRGTVSSGDLRRLSA